MRLKARKQGKKPRRVICRVYDATNDEIVAMWLRMPLTLNCPIFKTCEECGRCELK